MHPIPFEYTYAQLPERFYQKIGATTFESPHVLKWNTSLAKELKIDKSFWSNDELAKIFSGSYLLPAAQPLAQAYSGHQFGHFNPLLGDGRALLLGELRDAKGNLKDVHLKGSGKTQYSRRGDGKANLAAVVREYIVSESMFNLGIPSSRSLAIIGTGEIVQRDTEQPGAILVRIAASHIRIGTFEYFISRGDFDGAKLLTDFVIQRHHPDLSNDESGYIELFRRIVNSQAKLIASWLNIGFIHGVMNTDNTFISGETLDFGPCAFMEDYNPKAVFSSIDKTGRYSFENQPSILKWNLTSLCHCFMAFINPTNHNLLMDALNNFENIFKKYYHLGLAKKFGLTTFIDSDLNLFQDFFNILLSAKADFTLNFRNLKGLVESNIEIPSTYPVTEELNPWILKWHTRIHNQGLVSRDIIKLIEDTNPAYIPRNHRVEEAIQYALKNDYSKLDDLLEVMSCPYQERTKWSDYLLPADAKSRITETFCNT